MALFTNKLDVGLPLFTQIAQLDANAPQELLELVKRFGRYSQEDLDILFPENEAPNEGLETLGKLVILLQEIMADWADYGSGYPARWKELNRWLEVFPTCILRGWRFDWPDDMVLVPVDQITLTRTFSGDLSRFFGIILLDFTVLHDQAKDPAKPVLGKCDKCNSPFVIQKNHPDQKHCSHRCGARESRRLRRIRDKELK
jgi:hypothetical protein